MPLLKPPANMRPRVLWPSTLGHRVPVRHFQAWPPLKDQMAEQSESHSIQKRVRHGKPYPYGNKVSRRLTMVCEGEPPKGYILRSLGARLQYGMVDPPEAKGASHSPAVVILVSKQYAKWIEDETFLTDIIKSFPVIPKGGSTKFNRVFDKHQIDALVAVVDGIKPLGPTKEPQKGISILYTDSVKETLPGLWDDHVCPADEYDAKASISFPAKPMHINGNVISPELKITLPLANTVFQTGRHSTLFAARFEAEREKELCLIQKQYKTNQLVLPERVAAPSSQAQIPLLPITPPREILAGLGNIVRQVEVDGRPTPASKELEAIIPQIIQARSRGQTCDRPNQPAGPMSVWALVIPRHLATHNLVTQLAIVNLESPHPEAEAAKQRPDLFKTYCQLLSRGCRFHRILSGGGGWGPKQGLLSLDPEIRYQQPEDSVSDFEAFLRSQQGEKAQFDTDGLVTPGSRILFCIDTAMRNFPARLGMSVEQAVAQFQIQLGVTSGQGDDAAGVGTPFMTKSNNNEIIYKDGHFGGTSAEGLFLTSWIPPQRNKEFGGIDPSTEGDDCSRIDVPGTFLSTGMS